MGHSYGMIALVLICMIIQHFSVALLGGLPAVYYHFFSLFSDQAPFIAISKYCTAVLHQWNGRLVVPVATSHMRRPIRSGTPIMPASREGTRKLQVQVTDCLV